MWRKSSAVGGFGLALLLWVLEMSPVAIPLWLLITVGGIALGMIVFGSIPFIVGVTHVLQRVRLRVPIVILGRNHETQKASEMIQRGRELTQEQVAERLAFIQQLRGVAERLLKNSQGAETLSISSILRELFKEPPVKDYTANDGLANQAVHLLKNQLDDLFTRVSSHQRQTEELSTSLDDSDVLSICNTTSRLVLDYRQLVDETLILLDNLAKKGVPALWQSTPWSVRIHRGLADNYDELMRLVADLRMATPKDARSVLPKDSQLTKFPRASLYS